MEDQIFGFNLPKVAQTAKPNCSACGGPTVEVFAHGPRGASYTGIWRCLSDACDRYTDPTMPEVRS